VSRSKDKKIHNEKKDCDLKSIKSLEGKGKDSVYSTNIPFLVALNFF
jgi:hypothetical protein